MGAPFIITCLTILLVVEAKHAINHLSILTTYPLSSSLPHRLVRSQMGLYPMLHRNDSHEPRIYI